MPVSLKVAYRPYNQIAQIAYESLKKFGCELKLPVPVEHIIDNVLKINIIPFPYLFTSFEINAFTSSDLKNIYVDEYLYTYLNYQYRFTLAHELGHIILHKDIYSRVAINSLSEWKKFISEVNEDDYNQLEFQANCFAGLFLVPQHQLSRTFDVALKRQLMNVEKSKKRGIKREEYLPWVIDLISMDLAQVFEVDQQVIKIRIEREGLASKVP